MMTHTPTWYASKSAGHHQGLIADEHTGKTVALTYDIADAAYIIHAINAHVALVAALQWIAEHAREYGEIEDYETMVATMTARAESALALALAEKGA